MNWRVEYKVFRKRRETRDEVFDEAASFAEQLLAEQVIGISHALEKEHVLAVVWFWSQGSFWVCPKCGESIEEQFDACWRCSSAKPAAVNPTPEVQDPVSADAEEGSAAISYRTNLGEWLEWDDFFGELAQLATAIGPARLVSLAHSGPKDDALATVFFLQSKAPHEQTPDPQT